MATGEIQDPAKMMAQGDYDEDDDNDVAGSNLHQQIDNFTELVGNMMPGPEMDETEIAAMQEQLGLLHDAIDDDDIAKAQEIAASGEVDIDGKFSEEIHALHAGMTPLSLACALNKIGLAKVLLDNGADVNATFAALKTTALMTSAYHGHEEMVQLLIERGADVQIVDLQQSTALGYCFGGTRNMNIIEQLLVAGIDVNRKNMFGMNSLLLVAGYGNEELVSMVLSAGADPNAANDFDHSALHMTVVGKKDAIRKMKSFGSGDAAVTEHMSLNRRNLDTLVTEWAKLHRDAVGGTKENEEALARAGSFMMSIGKNLKDDIPDDDEQEQLQLRKRVEAVMIYRQEKINNKKQKRSSIVNTILSCGGGRSKAADTSVNAGAKPYAPPSNPGANDSEQDELSQMSNRFARILRQMIDAGATVDFPEKTFGMTPLDMAIINGDVESAAVLASSGGDPDHFLKMLSSNDLYTAITTKQKRHLRDLLMYDDDSDVNRAFLRFNVVQLNNEHHSLQQQAAEPHIGYTPLALAARIGDLEAVKILLKHGANVNLMGPSGRSALAEAAAQNHVKMIEVLLTSGAILELQCPGYKESTACIVAAVMQQYEATTLLIKKGAKIDIPMLDGSSAIFKAFQNQDMKMLDILLSVDTHANTSDPNGFTAGLCHKYQSRERNIQGIYDNIEEALRQHEEHKPKSKKGSKKKRHSGLRHGMESPGEAPPLIPVAPPVIPNEDVSPSGDMNANEPKVEPHQAAPLEEVPPSQPVLPSRDDEPPPAESSMREVPQAKAAPPPPPASMPPEEEPTDAEGSPSKSSPSEGSEITKEPITASTPPKVTDNSVESHENSIEKEETPVKIETSVDSNPPPVSAMPVNLPGNTTV